jgi:hypothetical protein
MLTFKSESCKYEQKYHTRYISYLLSIPPTTMILGNFSFYGLHCSNSYFALTAPSPNSELLVRWKKLPGYVVCLMQGV